MQLHDIPYKQPNKLVHECENMFISLTNYDSKTDACTVLVVLPNKLRFLPHRTYVAICKQITDVYILMKVHAHGDRSGHVVLFFVALLFSKLQTFRNNNPECNIIKSVYLTSEKCTYFQA